MDRACLWVETDCDKSTDLDGTRSEPIPTPAQLITVDALHLELFAAFVNHSEYLVEFAHLLPILDATRVLTNRMQLDTIAAMRHHADEVCERDSKPVKPSIKFPLPVLLTGLGLILAGG